MKEKSVKRRGRMLAWLLSFAMALGLVMVPADKVRAADLITVTNATDAANSVYVKIEVEKVIAAYSNEDHTWPTYDLTQYKASVINNSGGTISDWQVTIQSSDASSWNSGWNGATRSGNTITIGTYKGTDDTTGEIWTNAEIADGQSANGAGFQIAASALDGAEVTLTYHVGQSSGTPSVDDTATDPSVIGEQSAFVTATIKQDEISGSYHAYALEINNNSGDSISDWIVAIPMTGLTKVEQWDTSWNKYKVAYTDAYIYLTPVSPLEGVISAGGKYGSIEDGAYKFKYEGSNNVDASKVIVYYKTGSSSTGAFNSVISNATAAGGSGGGGGTGGSGGVQGDTTTDLNLDVEYNFAKLLQESLYFYDANMCGELEGKCGLDWRKNCHLRDKTVTYKGKTVDVSGGFHDAGDHDKFGLPQGYTASVLGIGYYEFKDAYEETGQSGHFKTILDYFCDYFVRCTVLDSNGDAEAFCYQVGDGASHHQWVSAEKENLDRPAYFADSTTPATDQVSEAAAALAIHYVNFNNETYLEYAEKLFAMAQRNGKQKQTDAQGGTFYGSSSWEDDYCLAAAWLYKATNKDIYLNEYKRYESQVDTGADPAWDQVGPYAVAYGGNFSPLAANASQKINSATKVSNGYAWISQWGSARYNCNIQLEGLVYDKNSGKEQQYTQWATGQMKFLLGNSADKRCYVVGYNANSSKYPHHRSASGYADWPNNGNNHTIQAHVLLGALVGGIEDTSGTYHDDSNDYYCNEVALDYNAAFVGAAAGLYLANKENPDIQKALASEEELSAIGVTKYYGSTEPPVPTPKAVLEASAAKLTCGAKEYGYTSADGARVTISNTGDAAADDISAALAKGDSFLIQAMPKTSLAAGETTDISVAPKAGLAAGTYEDTLTITYDSTKTVKVTVSFTVTKKNITIAADSISKEYGEENPALTYQITGSVVAGDSLNVTVSTAAKKDSDAGTYDINVEASNPNYQITCNKGTLTIRKKAVSDVAFPSVSNTVRIDDTVETALFSGGDTKYGTFAWEDSTQTFTEKGKVNVNMVLTLSAASKKNYDFSTVEGYVDGAVIRSLTVTVLAKDAPRITFPDASDIVYGQSLSDSELSFTETEYGSYAWKDETIVPDKVGKPTYTVVFTPNAEAVSKYELESIEQDISVNVTKQENSKIPEKPVLVKRTSDGIEVQPVTGVQYSMDNGVSWTTEDFTGKFSNLQAFTKYQVKARYAETETTKASAASLPLEIYTLVAAPYTVDVSKLSDAAYADALKIVTGNGEEATVTYTAADNTLQLLHNTDVHAEGYVLTGSNPGLTVKTGEGAYKITLKDTDIKSIDGASASALEIILIGESKIAAGITGAANGSVDTNAETMISGTGSLETGIIEGENITISGGNVTVTDHIKAEGQIVISGEGTTVMVGNTTEITGSAAIYAEDKIEITGGTVTVNTPAAEDVYGIGVGADGSIIIDGGTVKGNPTYSKEPVDKNGQVLNSIANALVSAITEQTYTGQAIKPVFTVTLDGKLLTASDYTVSYSGNVEPGTATIIITGTNGYRGEKRVTFAIVKKEENPPVENPPIENPPAVDPPVEIPPDDDPPMLPPLDDDGVIRKNAVYKIGNFSYKVTKPLINGKGTVSVTKATKKSKKVTIPATVKINGIIFKVTEIGANAFKNNTKLTTLKIGKNVTKIGSQAFYGCTKLKTVTLGSGVTTIGKKAFYNCKSVTKMTVSSKKLKQSKIGAGAFTKMGAKNYKKLTVKVPKAKLKVYKKMFKAKGLSKKAAVKK